MVADAEAAGLGTKQLVFIERGSFEILPFELKIVLDLRISNCSVLVVNINPIKLKSPIGKLHGSIPACLVTRILDFRSGWHNIRYSVDHDLRSSILGALRQSRTRTRA
jgi:hypothetical protein